MTRAPFTEPRDPTTAERSTFPSPQGEPTVESPAAVEVAAKTELGPRKRGGQFKKGQSGNPKGRPPKPKEELNDVLLRVLYEPVPIHVSGKSLSISIFEAMVRSMLALAMKEPRVSLAVVKTVLPLISPPNAADAQDNIEHDRALIERFRAREWQRYRSSAANDVGAIEDEASDDAVEPATDDEEDTERSA